jgi:hypothetical protein
MSKRSLFSVAVAGLLAVLGAGQAWAQLGTTLKADVPFTFVAGQATLPAGNYIIRQDTGVAQSVLLLQNEERGPGALVLTNPKETLRTSEETKLVFHRYGDKYFLAEVWVSGRNSGWQIPTSRSERELSRMAARADVVTILARL